ncbi:MAG: FecR domain-containing protein, partial [Candidatus Omnitrophica bacterium]|nr:FecR domain-containing protein [Candidatus Omnitrophota bacterium]
MKKNILTAVLVLLCISIAIFAANILLLREKIIYDQTNKTLVVKGDVKIKKAKVSAGWQKMEASTVLEKGDMVETAEGSMVDIVIGKDTDKAVKIDEKSRLEVQEINPAYLNLSKGKVFVALKKLEPRSSFTVKTPTAICGAQGTAWSEAVTGDKTKVCVFESRIYARELDEKGRAGFRKYTVDERTQRILQKGRPISEPQKISADDLEDWKYWGKNVEYLREGKVLINDFSRRENFNNLKGPFGSWVVFYSDANQYCRDEFTAFERTGETGYGLKLTYDVDSPFSAYNGFFTSLMGIDLTGYKYLVFYIKGDKRAGFTTRINVELKNKLQIGKLEVNGITDEWQKIVLSLEKFVGLT